MKTHVVTLTGNGSSAQTSDPIILDFRREDFKVSIFLDTDGSTTTGGVEFTLDHPWFPDTPYTTDFATNATWRDHASLVTLTADADGNLNYPVTAVRLKVGATGTDTWTMKVLQSGLA